MFEQCRGNCLYDCTSLKSVQIPDGVSSINAFLFYNCTSLENVTIPDSVTLIKGYTFTFCSSLNSVEIPASVESDVFNKCSSMKDIYYPVELRSQIADSSVPGTTMRASYTEKGEDASVIIDYLPSNVTSISLTEDICGKAITELYYPEGVALDGAESDGNRYEDMLLVNYKEVTVEEGEGSETTSTTAIALTIENIPSEVTSICLPDNINGKDISSVALAKTVENSDNITAIYYPASITDGVGSVFTSAAIQVAYTVNEDGSVNLTVNKLPEGVENIILPNDIGGKQIASIEFSDPSDSEKVKIECSEHNPVVEKNAQKHWYVCTVCGATVDENAHSYGTCVLCYGDG